MGDEKRSSRLATALLTVLVGVLLQLHTNPPTTAMGSDAGCSVDSAEPQTFVYPVEGAALRSDDDYVFAVSPVDGATAYRWEISQDDQQITGAIEQSGGLPDIGYELWHSLAYAEEARAFANTDIAPPPPELTPGVMYVVAYGSAAHDRIDPGDLTASVSAQVCGQWLPAVRATIHVECVSDGPDGAPPAPHNRCA